MPTPEETNQQPQAAPTGDAQTAAPQAPAPKSEATAQNTEATPKADTPKAPSSKVPQDERLLAASSYIPFLPFMGFVMKPQSKFCQMHGRQGVMTSILFVGVLMFLLIFGGFFIFQIIGSLIFLAYVALVGIAAFQAFNGTEWKIPVVYDVSTKMSFIDTLFLPTTAAPKAEAKTEATAEENKPTKPAETAAPQPTPAPAPAQPETTAPAPAPAAPSAKEAKPAEPAAPTQPETPAAPAAPAEPQPTNNNNPNPQS
jgi:uncharacterized membrane protein